MHCNKWHTYLNFDLIAKKKKKKKKTNIKSHLKIEITFAYLKPVLYGFNSISKKKKCHPFKITSIFTRGLR